MAFSFFKKNPGNRKPMGMVEVMAPKAQVGNMDNDFLEQSDPDAALTAPAEAGSQIAHDDDWTVEFDDPHTKVNGGYGVEIFEVNDPYSEVGEAAAIAYANGQNAMARSTLEEAVQDNSDPGALKLWHMLFDLFRMTGDQAAFDALGAQFARACELSPPSWSVAQGAQAKRGKPAASGLVAMQGILSGNTPALELLRKAIINKEPRRVDLGKLAGIDSDGAAALAEILTKARRLDLAWGLSQADSQADRLAVRLASSGQGEENAGLWQLLFELYHFLGREEDFEEKAVDYAVALELSPPSWDPPKKPPAIPDAAAGEKEAEAEPAKRLEGPILQGNMEPLQRFLKPGEENRLDFSGVSRVDFVSAGMLVNVLKTAGHVTIVHPNRLVAELLRVMGVDQVAKMELSRH
ncbi:MAG: STAS domain-containing protein [Zoogloeaceae bacterium]|nr:STAS domain-containing protein [Zoogloeaceae bacterium]